MYSNGQGFYLTLPSESSKGLFPENNPSEYSVRLPHWIHLKGEWEIGLHSIAYTRRNIIHHLDGTILYGYPEHDGTTTLATTGKMEKHYSSVGEYVSNINALLEESYVNKSEIEFTINTDGKVTITGSDVIPVYYCPGSHKSEPEVTSYPLNSVGVWRFSLIRPEMTSLYCRKSAN